MSVSSIDHIVFRTLYSERPSVVAHRPLDARLFSRGLLSEGRKLAVSPREAHIQGRNVQGSVCAQRVSSGGNAIAVLLVPGDDEVRWLRLEPKCARIDFLIT